MICLRLMYVSMRLPIYRQQVWVTYQHNPSLGLLIHDFICPKEAFKDFPEGQADHVDRP